LSPSPEDSRPGREVALAVLVFLALTVLMTWPQAMRLRNGLTDLWDAKFCARILAWDYEATVRPSLGLFQVPFFHPARYVLGFSENLYGAAIFGFPMHAAGASPLLAYNVLFLLGMFLSALSAWALARFVTRDARASLFAGVVYAFLPWRMSQIPHIQFQWGAFLALLLLFLLRYLEGGARRDAVLFGVAFGWNAVANVHYALFSGFLVGVALLLHAAYGGVGRGRRVRGALLAAAAGALAFVPFAIGYRKAAALYHMQRYYGEMETFSGTWTDFLSAGEKNRFWGPLTRTWLKPEGDFFPGLIALALAIVALATVRRARTPTPADSAIPASRRRAAVWLDAVALLLAALWLAAHIAPGLKLGPVSIGDPGRVQVFLTVVLLARLTLAFPARARSASLPDWLRRSRLPSRLVLLIVVAAVGVLIALGAHTPYYRFLFKSFGDIFRAIRVPARGIVLFDLSLGVLAAWGLSRLTRGRTRGARAAIVGGAIALTCVEYRAFPLAVYDYDASPAPVYRWLAGRDLPGAVVELPFGPRDAEYVFRQTLHRKPLVNGYSGFFPPLYVVLRDNLRVRPIPDAVWGHLAEADAAVLLLHFDETSPLDRLAFVRLLRRGLAAGKLETLAVFPHAGAQDLVFRVTSAPAFSTGLDAEARSAAEKELNVEDATLAPPIAGIVFDAPVSAGDWHGGWALDDSGVAEVRIASELGPAGSALLHMRHTGLAKNYPDFAEAADDRAGFGFPIPNLPPGPHTLTFTVSANDGGVTVVTRPITVVTKPRSR
jgi:hypothetical protein